jgi:molybdenum cofactor cytidylyltransferase
VLPQAVEAAGGDVLRLGMPVDPGNLALLARLGGVPVLGVPGCARSPRRNGFDWLLERVLAGYELEEIDVAGFGVGGLLKETRRRGARRRPTSASRRRPRVGGVILAAGRSTRMGEANKLLMPVDGEPMVRRVAEAAMGASLDPIVVVLGYEAEDVRRALNGLPLRFVQNPDYAAGMSTSVAAGVGAMSDASVDGAVILLGDMPWITDGDLTALTSAFAPDEGRGICVPMRGRQRGNPVLWGARYFEELKVLDGDVGGRHLLAEHDDEVYEVTVPGEGVLMDVDVPQALEASRPEG